MYFAFMQLEMLQARYGDEVERVDFWVEQNGSLTNRLAGFHQSLRGGLEYINRSHLVPLIGEFRAVDKARPEAQAADVLAWHARNHKRERLDRWGTSRYRRMITSGVSGRGRFGHLGEMDGEILQQLADQFSKNPSVLEVPPWADA